MTEPATVIRVLLADDQELVRDGFATILDLQDDIEVVGSVRRRRGGRRGGPRPGTGRGADGRADAGDGRDRGDPADPAGSPDCRRSLVLTTFDLDEYVFAALQAGASGFLLKDTPRAGLLAAVRAVAAGDALLSPAVTRRLVERFARRTPAADAAD